MHDEAQNARTRSLAATPAVERLLAKLSRSLALSIVVHGAGTVLAATTLWLAFAFFADYALHVPHAVRVARAAAPGIANRRRAGSRS